MAENEVYDIHNGTTYVPDSQSMSIELERAVPTDPPPSYYPGPQQLNFPAQQHNLPPQPQAAGAVYAPGYQQFENPPTSTTTTVVIHSQPCVMQMPMVRPQNYLVLSILSAFFCCPIFGIVGIIYAAQVDLAYDSGDYIQAHSKSSLAKGWTIAALVCGLLVVAPVLLSATLASHKK